MGRLRILGLFACLAALVAVPLPSAGQEATPTPAPDSSTVTRESLTSAAASQLAGIAGPLRIERIRIPAGGEWVLSPGEGALSVLVLEAGTVEGESPAPATIQRGATEENPSWADAIAADAAFTLNAGDALVSQAPAGTRLRNPGPEPANLISVGIGTGEAAGNAPAAGAADAGSGLVLALALVVPPPCPPGTEPGSPALAATPGAGGGGGGAGGVAVAFAAAPACIDEGATPVP